MKCVRNITEDLYYVGGNDRRLHLFENLFPLPSGVSYNSYLLLDEKTVLFDTVDYAVGRQFLENVDAVLDGRPLDYIIINHMEPDHCALLGQLMVKYPNVTLVGNAKTFTFLGQFFQLSGKEKCQIVAEGDTLETGTHRLTFVMAPMIHWPEVMVTYDEASQILFSADAFGTFGALDGKLFADEQNVGRRWMAEARRYYSNIVGKYGAQVQMLLKKAPKDIKMICPLHGPVWREGFEKLLAAYDAWSKYEPEEKGVVIAYASMYGNTELAAERLALELTERGVRNLKVYDVSETHVSHLISEIFRCSHLVLAAPTYNAGIYPAMKNLLEDMKALNVQKRRVALMENGSWAPMSGKLMRAELEDMKGMELLDPMVSLKSVCKEAQEEAIITLAELLAAEVC